MNSLIDALTTLGTYSLPMPSAKIKTDKLDAVKLANLLRGGYIAECYVPDRRIMDLRANLYRPFYYLPQLT